MRRPIIAGNWKMNMTPSEARALVEELKPLVKDAKCEVVVCPPYVDLSASLSRAAIYALALRIYTGQRRALLPAKFPQTCLRSWAWSTP